MVYRTPEERAANPDRLNLDRRRLAVCPILEGEEQLRLLNYQHNLISRIDNLSCMKRLIFLDLYDNHIDQISGLDALKSLRVLMLGKNRIKKILNLNSLTKLDVLDLHGNQISCIENLNHLTELRVLNLAGNCIRRVNKLSGLEALTELNLRRNQISTVTDVEGLPSLQRLFLSFNEISSFDDIMCLGDSSMLSEISLDGNPFASDPNYKQTVLSFMHQLKQFDMKRVSDEDHRSAVMKAKKEENKKKETTKVSIMKERRRLAISNARRHWEVNQGSLIHRTSKLVQSAMPELYANHVASVPNAELGIENDNESDTRSSTSHLDHLSELEGDTLTLYGMGALEALDKNWGMQAAGVITSIAFKFIEFDEISKVLHKIRVRFPNVTSLSFTSTNICFLHQLNCLSQVRRLDQLTIEAEGNPLTSFVLWRTYALFRLAHFSMKKVNNQEVSAADIVNAEKFFGTLSHMTTSQLPHSRLLTLLGEKKKQLLAEDKQRKPTLLESIKTPDRTSESVGRAGLTYTSPDVALQKTQDQQARKAFVSSYLSGLAKEAITADQRQVAVRQAWSQILTDMVHQLVAEMWDSKTYMKRCLEEIEQS
ncbi:hypothetical protein CAPTEDRAFT_183497 [Capitella teleta]|uniref:Leucine-rich repeat-containing protein 49 n=1 Tax=Capitella teleta TaxID=283909 RepID=R7TRJ3_CAPTE|nr:hypothetical protein CAPTEDRAFT_183497 [Capitella teleta]|eukprot:ELT96533.1 hypothetical protein CAPTEDRAFT_183497 [Capitella teleta]